MKLILALAFLFGALSVNAQDAPPSSQATGVAKPLTPNQARANIELNEAARAYRAGNFDEARQHAEAAQVIDRRAEEARHHTAELNLKNERQRENGLTIRPESPKTTKPEEPRP